MNIYIDYDKIGEYNKPFSMVLKVQNKKNYELWNVKNGMEALDIRKQYQELGRNTTYIGFYENELYAKDIYHNLNTKPRIRGKNKRTIEQTRLKLDAKKEEDLSSVILSKIKETKDIEDITKLIEIYKGLEV